MNGIPSSTIGQVQRGAVVLLGSLYMTLGMISRAFASEDDDSDKTLPHVKKQLLSLSFGGHLPFARSTFLTTPTMAVSGRIAGYQEHLDPIRISSPSLGMECRLATQHKGTVVEAIYYDKMRASARQRTVHAQSLPEEQYDPHASIESNVVGFGLLQRGYFGFSQGETPRTASFFSYGIGIYQQNATLIKRGTYYHHYNSSPRLFSDSYLVVINRDMTRTGARFSLGMESGSGLFGEAIVTLLPPVPLTFEFENSYGGYYETRVADIHLSGISARIGYRF